MCSLSTLFIYTIFVVRGLSFKYNIIPTTAINIQHIPLFAIFVFNIQLKSTSEKNSFDIKIHPTKNKKVLLFRFMS